MVSNAAWVQSRERSLLFGDRCDPRRSPFVSRWKLIPEYATGRLHFDSIDHYAAYAEHLVEYEAGPSFSTAVKPCFGPQRSIDPATSKSSRKLVQPLYDQLDPQLEFSKRLSEVTGELTGTESATKENLRSILSGPRPPAFTFTASHGMGYKHALSRTDRAAGCIDVPGVCLEYEDRQRAVVRREGSSRRRG